MWDFWIEQFPVPKLVRCNPAGRGIAKVDKLSRQVPFSEGQGDSLTIAHTIGHASCHSKAVPFSGKGWELINSFFFKKPDLELNKNSIEKSCFLSLAGEKKLSRNIQTRGLLSFHLKNRWICGRVYIKPCKNIDSFWNITNYWIRRIWMGLCYIPTVLSVCVLFCF